MSISSQLLTELRSRIGSEATISRQASRLILDHGPMSSDEARWVLAHNAGVDLSKFDLTDTQLDRVRQLRAPMNQQPVSAARPTSSIRAEPQNDDEEAPPVAPTTPSAEFNHRGFHPEVVTSSRRLFVGKHYSDAIRKAFQRVNNRVKKMSGLTQKDGKGLLGEAFKETNPPLQMTGLTNDSQRNEHEGTRFMMMGAWLAMRNPRSHEDSWDPDHDAVAVLEALAFASILHRFLDRCESYSNANP